MVVIWSFVEALGHTRVPFAGYRSDHRVGVELATIDPHRAVEAATDLERRLDDGVAGEARQDRFEIGDFAGRAIPFLLVLSGAVIVNSMWEETVPAAWVLPSPPAHFSPARSLRDNPVYHVEDETCRPVLMFDGENGGGPAPGLPGGFPFRQAIRMPAGPFYRLSA